MELFLEFQHVSYRYPGQDHYAVRDLSFSVNQGEFFGILGADDSGKTTLAKLISGIHRLSQGQITLAQTQEEFPLRRDRHKGSVDESFPQELTSRNKFHQKIGVVFSDPENQIVGTTVEEDVAFGLGNLQIPSDEIRKRVEIYLKRLGLWRYAKQPADQLSGGEQQKLCLAGILAMEPACLVLDEPLSFLDSKSRAELLDLLKNVNVSGGKTIIYLTSDPEELLDAHRIAILHKGRIFTQCALNVLWDTPELLENTGILPPDMMLFRHALRHRGYPIQQDSLSAETIARDIGRMKEETDEF
jgi:energy-coupling factor transport system ATP-binding protein